MVAPKGYKTVTGYAGANGDLEALQQSLVDGEVVGVCFAEGKLWPIEPEEWLTPSAPRALQRGEWWSGTWGGPLYLRTMESLVKELTPEPEPVRPDDVYLSPFMEMMLAAIKEFGITADSYAHVKKETLVDHFKAQKLPDGTSPSSSMAEMMATLIRPPQAMKGGQKRVG